MMLSHTYSLLLILIFCSYFSNLTSPTTRTPGTGFGNGAIDLGGLLICQINTFTKVWSSHEGGPDNVGATFYEPSPLPDGFFMLGSYSQSNINSLPGWVLVGKDITIDPLGQILRPPSDFILILNTTYLGIDQDSIAYIWQPIPPEKYTAVGSIITRSLEKPPLNKIRVVRSDYVVIQENGEWIWGAKDAASSESFNFYSSTKNGGNTTVMVQTGTFLVQNNGSSASFVSYLMNVAGNLSVMPNMAQIQELMEEYSPVIYFHPDERFFPSSVPWFFTNGALLYTKKGHESRPVLIDPVGSNLPQGGSNDGLVWIDLPTNDAARDKVKIGNLQGAGAYIHIKPTIGATCTDIVVWIFYPYNGPSKLKIGFVDVDLGKLGEHVGDWEHVTLRVSNFNSDLKSVYFSQHGKGVWIDGSEVEQQNGKKVVVYSSLNGHAAFPKAGRNLLGSSEFGIRNDAAKGNISMDTGLKYSIISADYLKPPIAHPHWLNYAREWGPKTSYDFTKEMRKVMKRFPKRMRSKFMKLFNKLPAEVFGQEGRTGPKWKDSWDGDERV